MIETVFSSLPITRQEVRDWKKQEIARLSKQGFESYEEQLSEHTLLISERCYLETLEREKDLFRESPFEVDLYKK